MVLPELPRRPAQPSPEPAGYRLPRIVRFLALHCAIGSALGAAFATLLMMSNVAGLSDLIATSEYPALPTAMLVVGCALTFASAAMAAAVMSLDADE